VYVDVLRLWVSVRRAAVCINDRWLP
jgi:hypothetical protein